MPRYDFHVHDGIELCDAVGFDLAGINAAREQAIDAIGNMMRGVTQGCEPGAPWRMHVTDETGRTILRFNFSIEMHYLRDQSV